MLPAEQLQRLWAIQLAAAFPQFSSLFPTAAAAATAAQGGPLSSLTAEQVHRFFGGIDDEHLGGGNVREVGGEPGRGPIGAIPLAIVAGH
jgi:hypothetical protein